MKKVRKEHLGDFQKLEGMRGDVDALQLEYDGLIQRFKDGIGLDEHVVSDLIVGIYNKFQDEILEHNNRGERKK